MELGLDYEHIPVEIGDAGARTPEFLAINPNGRLPVIDDDGFVLFESLAITLYLAKKHSNGGLYPGTLTDEAKAWQWTLWAVTEVDRGVNIWSLHAACRPRTATCSGSLRRWCWRRCSASPTALADVRSFGRRLHGRRSQRRRRHQSGDMDLGSRASRLAGAASASGGAAPALRPGRRGGPGRGDGRLRATMPADGAARAAGW
jgi:glutathione S-transferase